MNETFKKIFTSWRVIVLLLFLLFAVIAIQPQIFGNDGVTIRSVTPNSAASQAGMLNPSAKATPLAKEKIISFNGEKISSAEDYYNLASALNRNGTVTLETNKNVYRLNAVADENSQVDLGLRIYDAPSSNLRKGLDLEGGTRVLLKPAEPISKDDLDITIGNLRERLNVYGLSDIVVRAASDLAGEDFILIEIAGVTEEEIKELLAKQGKFEANIGNETVFFGGKKDITYVCRSADCSGIDPRSGCFKISSGGYACNFFFSITLSSEAAERQAQMTKKLTVVTEENGNYLSEELALILDDVEVDRLKIGAELKGSSTTDIQISGSGSGATQQEAVTVSLQNMKKLQTILITGSLPVKLDIVKIDTISPSLGKEFLDNIVLIFFLVVFAVAAIVFIRYRKAKIIIPMVLTLLSEVIMILGFAALVRWNLDLAAIAGIIIVIGTGVDQLVIITDETVKGEIVIDWKTRIKNAMFIITGAYLTVLSGMLPLLWAGAGLLKGFALTTIAGVSFGVLIARPAYAAIVEILLKE
ncbi:MAG: hypothetical protein AABW48_00815 [Nanoarchaeota archaeon]